MRSIAVLAFPLIAVLAGGCGSQDGVTPTSPDLSFAPTPPAITVSPNANPVVFDPVSAPFSIATSTTVTFTVSNVGTKPSGKISVSITGSGAAPYSIKKGDNGCTRSLRSNNSCTVKVTFAPSAIGTYLATLTVNTPQLKPAVSANLSGAGGSRFTIQQIVTSGPDVTADYSTTGGLNPATFQLGNGDTQSYTALAAGSYTATLTMPPGYSLDTSSGFGALSCSGNYLGENLTLDASTLTVGITIRAGSVDFAECIFRIYQST